MRYYRYRGIVIILILLSAALLPLTAQDDPDSQGSINAQGSTNAQESTNAQDGSGAEEGADTGINRLNSLQPAELASFFDTAVPLLMEKSAIAGTTVSVVKDGSIILQKGYGFSQVETGEPVHPDRTLFRIGSVTKLFIWTAVMQQIEEGKLSLDDPIDTRIDFTIPNPWETPITIRQLMTHTAGFEDQGFGMWAADSESLIPSAEWIQEHIPTVVRQPGTETSYSNYGAALAAYIVELASGLDFDTYSEKYLFLPLGMQHTTNRQPLPEHLEADMSAGYIQQNGKYIAQPFELLNLSPAGAASSTAADMALFMLDMLNDDSRLLSRETKTLMHQQAFIHDPRLENGMALGFYETTEQGIRIIGHGGDTMLFHSRLALFPEYELGIFVSTNSAGGSEMGTELISAFLDRFAPTDRFVPTDRLITTDPLAPTELTAERESESGSGSGSGGGIGGGIDISKVTGEYRMNRMSYTTPEKLYQTLAKLTLSAGPDGTVLINGYKGPEMYLPLGSGVFQKYLDDERILISADDDGAARLYVDSVPVLVFYKVPWYGTTALTLVLTVVLLILAGIWIVHVLRSRKRFKHQPLQTAAGRIFRISHTLLALAFFLLLISLAVVFGNIEALVTNQVSLLKPALLIPYIVAALTLVSTAGSLYEWVSPKYRKMTKTRIYASLLNIAAVGFTLELIYWQFL